MKLVDLMPNGDVVLNWQALPEPLAKNEQARVSVLNSLKERFGNDHLDTKKMFEVNKMAIELVKKIK